MASSPKKAKSTAAKEPAEAGGFAKSFDQYEYVAVITPGAALLLGLFLALRPQIPWGGLKDAGLAGFAVFLVAAYIAGHILRAVGDVFERLFWMLFGGMPSEWVLHAEPLKRGLLDKQQQKDLIERVTALGYKFSDYTLASGDDWRSRQAKFDRWQAVTRRIYVEVRGAGKSGRVDAFNRTYGMMAGITVALLIVGGLLLRQSYCEAAIAFVVALFCLYRMYLFGKLYARELYVSFLGTTKA